MFLEGTHDTFSYISVVTIQWCELQVNFILLNVFNQDFRGFIIKRMQLGIVNIPGQKLMEISIFIEEVTFEMDLEWLCNDGIQIVTVDD